jgi:hypothetical protein
MQFAGPRNTRQERLRDASAMKARRDRSRISDKRKNIGIGKHRRQRFQHALTAALRDEPMMNDSHAQVAPQRPTPKAYPDRPGRFVSSLSRLCHCGCEQLQRLPASYLSAAHEAPFHRQTAIRRSTRRNESAVSNDRRITGDGVFAPISQHCTPCRKVNSFQKVSDLVSSNTQQDFQNFSRTGLLSQGEVKARTTLLDGAEMKCRCVRNHLEEGLLPRGVGKG